MLRAGMRVVPTGGDDNHNAGGSLRCWTMIKAPELSYDALISAYENGDCYASEGPEIKALWIENGRVKVETSPAARIYLRSEGRFAPNKAGSELICFADFEYSPEKMGRFFRIEVRDAGGYRAWSNAYYVEDIEKKACGWLFAPFEDGGLAGFDYFAYLCVQIDTPGTKHP